MDPATPTKTTNPLSTPTSILTTAATLGLTGLGTFLATHGLMSSSGTEALISLAPFAAAAAVAGWREYVRPILTAQLEVLKAKSLAQAAALKTANLPKVTVSQIAAQSTMGPAEVVKAIATLPPEIKENVRPVAVMALAIGLAALGLGWPGVAHAQPATAPAKAVHHKVAHVPTPPIRPSQEALSAYAATPSKLTQAAVEQNPLTLLQKFSVDDLNAALADAKSQTPPDDTAIQCYTALIPIVQSNIANPLPAGPGMFQLAQKVRDFKALTANLQSPTGPLASLNRACAAWVLDGVNTFLGLGAQLGIVAGSGGVLGGLPFPLPFPLH